MKNSLMKKICIFFMMLCVVLTSGTFSLTYAKGNSVLKAQLLVDGKNKHTVNYINEKGKIFVSLNDAFIYIGGKYKFDGKNAVAQRNKDTIKVSVNSRKAYVNGVNVNLIASPKVINKQLYVPVSFLNEAIDGRIAFNSSKKVLDIKTKMPLLYTDSFSVTYLKGGIKKVTDGDKRTLILVPRGKSVPKEYINNIIVSTPIKNVLTASTTQACLLRPLNEISSIIGVTTAKKQWSISEVADNIENGKIKYVGESSSPDYEKISAIKPEIAFCYSGPSGEQSMMKKLDELKIKYSVDNEYLEENPLGRMEWIKFMAAFYNKDEQAEVYCNAVANKLNAMVKKVSKAKKPKIAWGSIYKGQVYIPKDNSYVTKMIEMAGGENVFDKAGVGSGSISIEEFYAKAKNADIFIYSSSINYTPTLSGIIQQSPSLASMEAVKSKKVWCFDPDYWQSIDKTDELITDLAAIFHPEIYSKHTVKHYIKYTK